MQSSLNPTAAETTGLTGLLGEEQGQQHSTADYHTMDAPKDGGAARPPARRSASINAVLNMMNGAPGVNNDLEWDATSRVQVNGYLPDLEPLTRQASIKYKIDMDWKDKPTTPFPSTPVFRAARKAVMGGQGCSRALADFFREGSTRGSIFNLCSATLGAGALSLPLAFSKTGVVLGTVLLMTAAVATLFSIKLLIMTAKSTGLKSYEEMTVALFGKVPNPLITLLLHLRLLFQLQPHISPTDRGAVCSPRTSGIWPSSTS
jgi:hypothetical protein